MPRRLNTSTGLLLSWAIAALLVWAVTKGLDAGDAGPQTGETVVHVVFVWLKDPGNDEHADRIIRATHRLSDIPGVRAVKVGRVMHSERPIVEDGYDVGLYLEFDNREDMEAYLVHPIHQKAVNEVFKPLAARYLAYDFLHRIPESTFADP